MVLPYQSESIPATNIFFCPEIEETSELEKISIARTVEETAFARDKRVSAVRSSGYSDYILEAEIRNSLGLRNPGKGRAGSDMDRINGPVYKRTGDELLERSGQKPENA